MTKHFKVIQSQNEINVQAQLIKKLYDLVCKHELTEEEYDNTTNLVGEITLASPTYKMYGDKVKEAFPELTINSLYYMLFQDPATEAVMSAYLLSKGLGDGIGITYDDAKSNAISQLPNLKQNTDIQYFNELPNFEKITILTSQQFMGCSNLKEVNLSNIDLIQNNSTFLGCTSLEKITLGRATSVPSEFASNCEKLTTVENSGLLTTISNRAFGHCTLLENIDLSNVQTVGDEGFYGCSTLGEVDLSNIVTVGNRGFSQCQNMKLKYASLPNLNSIGPEGFMKTKITSVDAPSCTIIRQNAFQECSLLTSINIPNVQTIGNNAFYKDSQLSIDVNFPNLTSLDYGSFRSSGITKISSLGSITTIPNNCFEAASLTVIENNSLDAVTSIGSAAFLNCKSLTSIGTLSNITTIGNSAFNGCSALTSLSLPETVISIENAAFYLCTSCIINDLNLPNLTSIGNETFRGTKIKKITSLGDITTISNGCFFDCKELTTIENNALSNITTIVNSAFGGCTALTSLSLPETVISIGDNAFNSCTSYIINNLNLPNLTSIGHDAFRGTKVKKITSLGNITTIPYSCFFDCKELTAIENNALSNITEIGSNAFNSCTALTTIGDISNVVKIENAALNGTIINSIDLSNVKIIGSSAIGINNTTINFKLTDAGAIDLTSIERLDSWAFNYGNTLRNANSEYLDVGTHLVFINTQPFNTLNVHVIIRSTTPPEFNASGYSHLDTAIDRYVYVPDEALNTYINAYPGNPTNIKPISELPVALQ